MAIINGTPENDLLRGTPEADSIVGLAGNDRIFGGRGNDRLSGNRGNDRIFGGRGSDRLGGGVGNDILRGNQGNDRIFGGRGSDRLGGGVGDDRLNGNQGNDRIFGGRGSDRIFGGNGNDILTGSTTNSVGEIDTLTGGAGADRFILGNATTTFYDDRNSATAGRRDYALVTGFNTSDDVIQLNGTKNDYVLAESPNNLPDGTAIYLDKPEGEPDELIGIVQGSPNLSLDGDYFSFTDTGAPPAELNLSDLDGSNGFVINGINAGDFSGGSVSNAGDVNGDGFDDIIIGANGANPNGQSRAGSSYVVFGKGDGFDPSLNLSDLNGSNGFVINGINEYNFLGYSVSSAGDVNGDEVDDIIIGALGADPNGQDGAGSSYVVFGQREGFNPSFNLSDLNGSNGFAINGINEDDDSGASVSTAGDINGDGFDDILIGAPGSDPYSENNFDGESYVVFGKAEGFSANLNLSALNGSNGFLINGIDDEFDELGGSVSNAGDVNGDGFDDIIIGARRADGGNDQYPAGESYVVFGKREGFDPSLNISDLNGSNGFVLNGIDALDSLGYSVSSAGDVNGDGIGDIVIGANDADPNGQDGAGSSYVVFGQREGFNPSFNLSDLNGSNGFVINGINQGNRSGTSVSTAGDFNDDGFDDILIGASGAAPNGQSTAGESYVVFGKGEGFDANLNLSDLNGSNGFKINGIDAFDYSGGSVSSVGDVNGDGFDDIIIGAVGSDPNGQDLAGESYVIFGRDFTAATLDIGTLDPINQSFASNSMMPTGQNLPFGSTTTANNIFDQHNVGISPLLVGTDIT